MKQIPDKKRGVEAQFRALTSLVQAQYEIILPIFEELTVKKMSQYTLKGARRSLRVYKERKDSSLYGGKSKLDFLLTYLKENSNQSFHALLFEMSQSKVSEWLKFLLPILEESLSKLGFMPQTGDVYSLEEQEDIDLVIIDVVEREVPRKTDYLSQKDEYSGKKKKHTLKNLAITDQDKTILFASDSFEGKTHDKSILDKISIEVNDLNILADLGFLGMDKQYENAILPFKKPKNKELTKNQKLINTAISKVRVGVEHAFAGVKILKIIRNKIRLKGNEVRHRVMMIAMALHNLRLNSIP